MGRVWRNRRIINVIAKPYNVAAVVMYSLFSTKHSPLIKMSCSSPFFYKHIFVLVVCALIINRVCYICADNVTTDFDFGAVNGQQSNYF